MTRKKAGAVKCAIYTRKSSEDGLEQEFNSLDAQREACEAYIQSQKHEGWSVLPGLYDDGGFSGGNMQRPALERLFDGVREGKIDTVVVYKIDRLTRSLADFAKMVELFDKHGVTFVSITQQFNTTTSMGRLTLNVLLSFAQFEREVTGERIRDKIAASKKKGMWMGGNTPMGYDVLDHKLVVNEQSAQIVRHVFTRYLRLGSVSLLKEELDREGIATPIRIASTSGKRSGGRPLSRGALYRMLANRVYIGEIAHKGKIYDGRHQAIVDRKLFDQVQAKLGDNRVRKTNGATCKQPSLLAGLVFDGNGERLTPTHANKKGKRYRYYISRSLSTGRRANNPAALRIPAQKLEQLISERLRELLTNEVELLDAVSGHVENSQRSLLTDRGERLAREWWSKAPSQKRAIFLALIRRIDVSSHTTAIALSPRQLAKLLLDGPDHCPPAPKEADREQPMIMTVDFEPGQCGPGMRMIIEGGSAKDKREPNKKLIQLIAKAHLMMNQLTSGEPMTIGEIARQQGCSGSYATRIIRLAFLSPDITIAILNGEQPAGLTPESLMKDTRYPMEWRKQQAVFETQFSPRTPANE